MCCLQVRAKLLALALAVCSGSTQAAAILPDFEDTLIVGGLTLPTAMAQAPDGRWFVCQQGGQLRVVETATLLTAPFLVVNVTTDGERGLLGVAFDPGFAVNHFVYIYYTVATAPIHNRVSRFTANGNTAIPGSETILLDLDNLGLATNHNGGALHFAADGTLYIAAGENGVPANAQTLGNLLGKILRINPDGTIPTDNPFYATASGKNRAIWAMGLRNPFTFAIHPISGRLFINDVGQSTWEEINDGIAGSNYGWPLSEGVTGPPYRSPVFTYSHSGDPLSKGCAITGGTFYVPNSNPFPANYLGRYFFADFCAGWIRSLDPLTMNDAIFATGLSFPVDLQNGADGCLYYLTRGPSLGTLGKICSAPGHRSPTGVYLAGDALALTQYASFYQPASGTLASQPAAAQNASGNTFTAARDGYGAIWLNVFDATLQDWKGFQFAGGILQGMPSVTVSSGVAYFSARDAYNAYWINRYDATSGFGGWQNLGGVFTTDPVMAASADGSIYLAGRDNFGGIWSGRYLLSSGFQGWTFGGAVTQGKPSVAAGADNAAYISVRDNSSALWLGRVFHESWTGWFAGGGVAGSDSQVAAVGGIVYAAVIDSYGGAWYRPFLEGTANSFQSWVFSGGAVKEFSPATGGNAMYFVGRDVNNTVWWYGVATGLWNYVAGNAATPVSGAK
jgi:glucose/arabinose dehydrogenase